VASSGFDNPEAGLRVCLSCNREFKSRGPWNRICGRCHEEHMLVETTTTYRVSGEMPRAERDEA
jgi:hypothetical protein